MDLGTANTLIHKQGSGIVLNEPSVAALDETTGHIVALGSKAKSFIGKTPQNIRTVRPLRDGVIADYQVAHEMIHGFLEQVSAKGLFSRPTLVIGVPSGITQVEKRAVLKASEQGGAGRVYMMEEPMAAAIGAGLDAASPEGKLVMDIGGGTTEAALISLHSTVFKESLRVAGDEMDQSIMRYLEEEHNIVVGENRAEQIKLEIGTAIPPPQALTMEVSGKGRKDGVPRTVTLNDTQIRGALEGPLKAIENLLMKILSALTPEFLNDVGQSGLTLAGGGALLRGLDQRLAGVSGLKVNLDKDPLLTVVRGTGMVLDNMKEYKDVFIN